MIGLPFSWRGWSSGHVQIAGLILLIVGVRFLSLSLYPLLDTTEGRYGEIARKMAELGDWVTPMFVDGSPFWGKPPLSFWLSALSFKLLGTNEFAARLPLWLCAVATLWVVYGLAAMRSQRDALYTMAILCGGWMFCVSAGIVMTDMVLSLAVAIALRGFWVGLHGPENRRLSERWWLFVGIGLGLLVKGPVMLVLVGLPIVLWSIVTGNVRVALRGMPWLRGALLVSVVALPWYVVAEIRTPGFIEYFIVGEHWQRYLEPGWTGDLYGAGHEHRFGAIWGYALVGMLPWTVLLPVVLLRSRHERRRGPVDAEASSWRWFTLSWGLAPLLFFSFASNLLPAYFLPGMAGLSLWLVECMRNVDRALLEKALVAGLATSLLVVGTATYLLAFTDEAESRSTRALVHDFQAIEHDVPIMFLDKAPFSSFFYTRGQVQVLASDEVTELANEAPLIVAMRASERDAFSPDLSSRFETVSQRGDYLLLRIRRD